MNTALLPIAHPSLKDLSGIAILTGLDSDIKDNDLSYEINTNRATLSGLSIKSPELGKEQRQGMIVKKTNGVAVLHISLEGVKVYAVVQ